MLSYLKLMSTDSSIKVEMFFLLSFQPLTEFPLDEPHQLPELSRLYKVPGQGQGEKNGSPMFLCLFPLPPLYFLFYYD